MDEETFKPSPSASLIGSIGAVLLIVFGVFIILEEHHWIVGSLGIVGGMVLGIPPFQYLSWRQPTVTLSSAGFIVTLPSLGREPYSSGLVAWNSVVDVSITQGGARTPGSRISIKFERAQKRGVPVFSTIKIPGDAIDVRAAELVEKIKKYRESGREHRPGTGRPSS